MSFEELNPPIQMAPPKALVKIGMVRVRRNRPLNLTIIIRQEVLDVLGENTPRRYRAAIGKADDAHWIRLVWAGDGPFEAVELSHPNGAGIFRMRLGNHERFPRCDVPLQETDYKHDKIAKCILIGLPSWAWDASRRAELERMHEEVARP